MIDGSFEAWMPEGMQDESISIGDAVAQGRGKRKMSSERFAKPFYGVRALQEAPTALQHAHQYKPRLKSEQWFGGLTAMRLWGLPLPTPWRREESLRLVVPQGAYRPQSRGVISSRLIRRRLVTTQLDGLPVLEPVQAILQASADLSDIDLLVAMDALVTSSDVYPARHGALGSWSPTEISERINTWGGGTAAARLRAALRRARIGVDSPQETVLRATLVDADLPEPEVQIAVRIDGAGYRLDTAWPEFRVAGEYEGDHHRTDARQWHRDIARERALATAGWTVVRVTKQDMRPAGRSGLVDTFRSALRRNGYQPKK